MLRRFDEGDQNEKWDNVSKIWWEVFGWKVFHVLALYYTSKCWF